ncbi:MAG TPA: SDR family oxidoreductase [Plasticicumulans sp.]|uniref:SDR family oxidoreductase n=1 Tax=Plasticicumulans sp. TaxID=2307179 RepID=UPI000FAB2AB2|nr:SDR family oxidoreductase [Plasticicumulans sp.]MBS0601313.1 SDR family oxidoreductase [Pseudomonadota bacterium]RTL05238.1 MAG: SDR family oxidoreductase [Xanthomonadales bacterium]HMW30686.1 SDR family oxidoreductase [Plasticicumulans sp.]HNF67572.1 SDR family oxidoreductase [Plasticicumulans sp.]HNI23263.1 SDR family oxidoreductase [Plasticicumulans sp.]
MMMSESRQTLPPQQQDRQPGLQGAMQPQPDTRPRYPGSGRLRDRVALISGGDSGIGRAVALAFAREGADVTILYFNEHQDAHETVRLIEAEGRQCLAIDGDIGKPAFCRSAVAQTIERFGRLDVLVNNAAEQYPQERIEDISPEQLERTFRTNLYGQFFLIQAALAHLHEGAAIINTTSVTAYHGSPKLLDYSATKGAIVAFTRSLALSLLERGIRVNAVAPGPIWTPLIPATFSADEVASFGAHTPMQRPGQPDEVAASYVFLACADSSYMAGQVLHPNGGQIVNG